MEWVDIERVRGREGGRGKKKRVGEDVMVRGTKGDGVGGRKEKREGGGEGGRRKGGGREGWSLWSCSDNYNFALKFIRTRTHMHTSKSTHPSF